METLLPSLLNYGFGGIMAAVVVLFHWYVMKVILPGIVSAFREELAAERKQRHEDNQAIREEIREMRSDFLMLEGRFPSIPPVPPVKDKPI